MLPSNVFRAGLVGLGKSLARELGPDKVVAFLCSEANAYLSGQNLLIDGGMVAAY